MIESRDDTWTKLKKDLEKLSEEKFTGIGIELLQSKIVPLGARMGCGIECWKAGTLGGFVKLKNKDSGELEDGLFAMTNHHIVSHDIKEIRKGYDTVTDAIPVYL